MFKLIIAGSRGYNYYQGVKDSFFHFLNDNNLKINDIEIVSGGARGPDTLGIQLANELNIPYVIFSANWNLGKSAGYKRNKEMAEYADGLLAIHDGISKGTQHMIQLAIEKGLLVKVINY